MGGNLTLRTLKPNGERIARLRSQKGLSQEACAEKISPKTLRKIERGEPVREQPLQRLADLLGVELEDIVDPIDQHCVKSLETYRDEWRNTHDSDLIITDKLVNSSRSKIMPLEPINELIFVDSVRSAEILKWHVDLVNPSPEKVKYLEKVADRVDFFRRYIKGVGGSIGMNTEIRSGTYDGLIEKDFSFEDAVMKQRRIIELQELLSWSSEFGIRFLWVRYKYMGQKRRTFINDTKAPLEQDVRLILATDSDRNDVFALVYIGTSPYDDERVEEGKPM
jgi:transcriptional regulator with XRE-family HTH domain